MFKLYYKYFVDKSKQLTQKTSVATNNIFPVFGLSPPCHFFALKSLNPFPYAFALWLGWAKTVNLVCVKRMIFAFKQQVTIHQ